MATLQQRRLLLGANKRPLARDSFTGVDGTNLTAHTPEVGGPWTARIGVVQITGNKAQAASLVGAQAHYTLNLGVADHAIGGTLIAPVGNNLGLITRYVDDNNLFVGLINASSGKVELYERASGGFTLRAQGGAVVANTPTRIVVQPIGATINVWQDGVLVGTYASATAGQSSTVVGMRFTTTVSTIDDLVSYRTGAVAVPLGVI